MNEKFEELMQDLWRVEQQKKEIDEKEKALKKDLQEMMKDDDFEAVEDEFLKVSIVSPKPSESIDMKALQKKEPELFEDLKKDYLKVVEKSPYLKVTVKTK